MKRHAYLITVYNDLYTLEKNLLLLDSPFNDIYIHFDLKLGDVEKWKEENLSIVKHSKVYFLDRRDIKWGEYLFTETMLDFLHTATKREYHYYHLITNADMPIRSQTSIHDFFDNQDVDLLFFHINRDTAKVIQDRCKAYYPFIKTDIFRKCKILKGISLVIGKIQILFGVNRLRNNPIAPIYNGWDLFSIPHDFACYCVEQWPLIKKTFKYTLASDEMWIHSVAANSKFRDRIYAFTIDECIPAKSSKHFQLWNGSKPVTLTKEHFEQIFNDEYDCFFARKVDSNVDKELVDLIYDKISKE